MNKVSITQKQLKTILIKLNFTFKNLKETGE